jgi:hypothetical protein
MRPQVQPNTRESTEFLRCPRSLKTGYRRCYFTSVVPERLCRHLVLGRVKPVTLVEEPSNLLIT